MNKDTLKGNWQQTKGKIKQMWGRLSDNEIEQIEGNYDELVGKVQEKYGYSLDKSREQVKRFINNINQTIN